MTIIDETPPDAAKLEQFVFRAVEEVGATLNTALVVMGDRLGLYRALAGAGALTPAELAARTGTAERYVREWLNAQAAGGYVTYHPADGHLQPAARAGGRVLRRGQPGLSAGALSERARLGARLAAHHRRRPHGRGRRLARAQPCTSTRAASASSARATTPTSSTRGCPRSTASSQSSSGAPGSPTSAAATAPRRSSWPGPSPTRRSSVRLPRPSIQTARRRAEQAGVGDRVRFEVEPAAAYRGTGYDLVTFFDCLHDMGDPVGAARHVRDTLAPDGTWMIVEPAAGDRLEDNLNPVGRAFYGSSTLLCTPASLSQEVGLALGAQAGEARLREVVTAGGFTRFRRAAETPFNLVLEARP